MSGFEFEPRPAKHPKEKKETNEFVPERLQEEKEKREDVEKKGRFSALIELAGDVRDSVVGAYRGQVDALKQTIEAQQNGRKSDAETSGEKKPLLSVLVGGLMAGGSWVKKTFEGLFGWTLKKDEDAAGANGARSAEGVSGVGEEGIVGKRQKDKAADEAATEKASVGKGDYVKNAKKKLEKVIEHKKDWVGYAKAAAEKFGVPVNMILAIINFESNFDEKAKARTSSASGLGQFLKATWGEFLAVIPKFAKAGPFDPEAGIWAIAWYCKTNADTQPKIDLNAPDAAARIYMKHHEGAEGYRRLMDFVENGVRFLVLKSYRNKNFSAFGIRVGGENDCENYSKLILAMAARVQKVTDAYGQMLN